MKGSEKANVLREEKKKKAILTSAITHTSKSSLLKKYSISHYQKAANRI